MKILMEIGEEKISKVYLGEINEGQIIEFAEALNPPKSFKEKWILLISTQLGCPIKCIFCDAGGFFKRNLKAEEILMQIDFLISKKFPSKYVNCKKFKIQFARVGEPLLNSEILKVLVKLPLNFKCKTLIPSISTVAPKKGIEVFKEIKKIKDKLYAKGNFQFQFSIHSTREERRNWITPIKKLSLEEISHYGNYFYEKGDKKIALNFALIEGEDIEEEKIKKIFNPEIFLIKITPVNPTISAIKNKIPSLFFENPLAWKEKILKLKETGFEVIESIGELQENEIGSNCGMFIQKYLREPFKLPQNSYSYLQKI